MLKAEKKIWDLYGDERAKSWVRHDDIDGYEWEVLGTGDYIPDVPNLAQIARYLAEHPETVDALETSLYNQGWFISAEKFNLVKWLLKAMRGEGGHE